MKILHSGRYPMETTAERVQFVIRFAQTDLDTLRPGDWLNLRDDLKTFLGCNPAQRGTLADRGGILAFPLQHPLPDEFSEDDFRALQKEANVILQSQVHEGRIGMD